MRAWKQFFPGTILRPHCQKFCRRPGLMVAVVWIATCWLPQVGCQPQSQVYPVTGKVVYKDGEAIMGGQVEFESQEHEQRLNARGKINSDGSFHLGTYTLDDGALLGAHKAIVIPPMRSESNPQLVGKEIHLRFRNYTDSPLEFTVEAKENYFEIAVEPP